MAQRVASGPRVPIPVAKSSPAAPPVRREAPGLKWRLKALVQHCCSLVPRGEALNYLLQRHITKSLPRTEDEFAEYVSYGQHHAELLSRHGSRPVTEATFYEFGAGWDLIVPLTLRSCGAARQILVDIRPLMRPELVNDTLTRLRRGEQAGRPLPAEYDQARAVLREDYAIDYQAPADARRAPLADASVDYITSTNTLEHIPPADIAAILRDCHRILRDDGRMSFLVDYQDHFSYFDSRVSVYHFLRYSDREWAWYNPGLHYQTRLRHRDYAELYRDAGFEVVDEERRDGTEADLAVLSELPLDARFKDYRLEELAVRNAFVVLRKRR